jgi:hypothetical protein
MAKRKRIGVIAGLGIVLAAAALSSCSTFPVATVQSAVMGMDVLGYVGASFATYDEALAVAREKYPNADAVVEARAIADNNIISVKKVMGYYAVKFKVVDGAIPRQKVFGIF